MNHALLCNYKMMSQTCTCNICRYDFNNAESLGSSAASASSSLGAKNTSNTTNNNTSSSHFTNQSLFTNELVLSLLLKQQLQMNTTANSSSSSSAKSASSDPADGVTSKDASCGLQPLHAQQQLSFNKSMSISETIAAD